MLKRFLLALTCTVMLVQVQAQNAKLAADLPAILNFETEHSGTMPRGWGGGPTETIFVDHDVVHGGRTSARLDRNSRSSEMFSTITNSVPVEFGGKTIEWRGFLRTEDVSGFTGLWMREDADTGPVAFDNMQQRQINGTRNWTEYSVTLPVRSEAKRLFFGVLLSGTGKVWADDLQLLVDGKPVWDAPKAERTKTILDLDHEFDAGSQVALSSITSLQIQNLGTLAKVWGFLKYHHPAVTSGKRHWDYELFRIMPKILAAQSRDAASVAMRDWIQHLGDVPACQTCASLQDDDLQLKPDLGWIDQENPELAGLLRSLYRNRAREGQFYVSQAPNVGNPVFEREFPYPAIKFPDAGYQLLGLFRLWNIVEYWYPYRNVLDQDWSQVLLEFIPRTALAKDKNAYQLEMVALIGKITDTHANLWNLPPQLRPPTGTCQVPVLTRFIEDRPVVTGYSHEKDGPATGLKIGDIIDSLDGQPVRELIERWIPYYPASNQAARLRDIARAMTRGACSPVAVAVRRENTSLTLTAERIPLSNLNNSTAATHELPGETLRLLSNDIAYLKLSSVKASEAATYIQRANATKGLVIDIRNYPSEFVVFALGSLLVDETTPFARFTTGDLQNPGAFHWTKPVTLTPQKPHYTGKLAILVDETSQSQAEYTAMAFRSAPHAIVVGSMTAGADGNVSQIALPGGLSTMISGIGVFYPDKKPTQRVGIVPDIEVKPTIAGIRAGRDEVLDEAVRQVLR